MKSKYPVNKREIIKGNSTKLMVAEEKHKNKICLKSDYKKMID
jgi:hypothetical protein